MFSLAQNFEIDSNNPFYGPDLNLNLQFMWNLTRLCRIPKKNGNPKRRGENKCLSETVCNFGVGLYSFTRHSTNRAKCVLARFHFHTWNTLTLKEEILKQYFILRFFTMVINVNEKKTLCRVNALVTDYWDAKLYKTSINPRLC